jgi:hypothetical protein
MQSPQLVSPMERRLQTIGSCRLRGPGDRDRQAKVENEKEVSDGISQGL